MFGPPSCVDRFFLTALMQLQPCKPNLFFFLPKQNNSSTILVLCSSLCPWTDSSSIPAFALSAPRLHISRHPLAACRSHYLISPCLQLQCRVPSGDVCGILQKVRRACLNLPQVAPGRAELSWAGPGRAGPGFTQLGLVATSSSGEGIQALSREKGGDFNSAQLYFIESLCEFAKLQLLPKIMRA